jgi:CHAT domain-containing protein
MTVDMEKHRAMVPPSEVRKRCDSMSRNYRLPRWLILLALIIASPLPWLLSAGQVLTPTVGRQVDGNLSGNEIHSFTFELSHGKFLRADFYSPDIDLAVSIARPNGTKSQDWSIPKRIVSPISCVADVPGTYRLEVRGAASSMSSGTYQIEIKELRPVSGRDGNQVTASSLLSRAAELRRQWTEQSLKDSIRDYEDALSIWERVADRSQQAACLKSAGDVYVILSDPEKALTYYEKARALYIEMNDRAGETAVINAISSDYVLRGEYRKALDLLTPQLASIEERWERAQALNNLGAAYWGSNDMQKAADFLNQALALREALRDQAGQADTLLNLGYVNHALKDLTKAGEYYRRSLELWRESGNPRGTALSLTALGHLANISGDRQRALEYYDQANQIYRTVGDLSGRCEVVEGIAYLHAGVGDRERALRYYLEALDLARRTRTPAAEGPILHYISETYRNLGDCNSALQYSRQAVLVHRSMPSILGEAYALVDVGKALEGLGKTEDAAGEYSRALELGRERGDLFLEGLLLSTLGDLHRGTGRLTEALRYYRQAMELQQRANDSVRISATLCNLSRTERDLGDVRAAIEYAATGLKNAESLRVKVAGSELRSSYMASVYQHYELMIDLLMQLHRQNPSEKSDAEALQVSEQARARALLDSLAEAKVDIRQGADPVLLERENASLKNLNARAAQQMRLLNGKHSGEEAAALAEQIQALAAAHDEIQALIRSKSPHYAALTQPAPLTSEEIQRLVVDENTLLLEYALGEERSYLWAATSTALHSYELPKRVEIEKGANRVRELMSVRKLGPGETAMQFQRRMKRSEEEYWRQAAVLSGTLLGPVSDLLESRRLLVVAEGALQYLPFGALPKPPSPGTGGTNKSNPGIPLIADHEIINLPSASVLAVLRSETKGRALPPKIVAVMADPVFDTGDPRVGAGSHSNKVTGRSQEGIAVSRLPSTRDEAKAILALAPRELVLGLFDFNANRMIAMGPELGQYRIVHIATHGFMDGGHPELSGLMLSLVDEQGRPREGFLRLHDIYNLKLPVELVVLSACESALGKEVRGEGMVGIVRGFIYAGATRVVSSLWRVDDESTAGLMQRFYRGMLKDGMAPAAALRAAQVEMWNHPRWSAPYYWAGFILQGEYR